MATKVLIIFSKPPGQSGGEQQKNRAFIKFLESQPNYAVRKVYNNPNKRKLLRVIRATTAFLLGGSARAAYFRPSFINAMGYEIVIFSLLQNVPYVFLKGLNSRIYCDYADQISQTYVARSSSSKGSLTKLFWKLEAQRFGRFEKKFSNQFCKIFFASKVDTYDYPSSLQLPNPIFGLKSLGYSDVGASHNLPSGYYLFGGDLSVYQNFYTLGILDNLPRSRFPIYVYGNAPEATIRRFGNLNFLGYVEDHIPLLLRCRAFLCPVPVSGGVQTKIIEALAANVPVFASGSALRRAGCSEKYIKKFSFSAFGKFDWDEFDSHFLEALMTKESERVRYVYGYDAFSKVLENALCEYQDASNENNRTRT